MCAVDGVHIHFLNESARAKVTTCGPSNCVMKPANTALIYVLAKKRTARVQWVEEIADKVWAGHMRWRTGKAMLHVTGIPLIRENRLVYSLNRATETRPAHKMEGGVQLSNSIPNESLLFVARILSGFEFLLRFTAKVAKSGIVQKLIQDKRNNHQKF